MLLSSYNDWPGARPKIVGEVSQKERREIAVIAGQRSIPILSSSQIVSKVIVQCARESGLSAVYAEVFSFEGNSIHVLEFPDCAGLGFREASCTFRDATLIGVSRATTNHRGSTFVPVLNPGRDYVITPGEWLIFLSGGRELARDRGRVGAKPPVPRRPPLAAAPLENLLIIGWNPNIHDVVAEFDEYVGPGTRVEIVSAYDPEEAQRRMAECGSTSFANVRVGYRRANSILRSALEALDVATFDAMIVLADESHGEPDPDARTIMSLILLNDIRRAQSRGVGPRVVVELLNRKDRELLRGADISDVVVSPDIASMLLTQISQQQMLTAIYDELLNSGGVEIYLKPASHYAEPGKSTTFDQFIASAHQNGEIALGLSLAPRSGQPGEAPQILLTPSREAAWVCGEHDRLVVLATDLYA